MQMRLECFGLNTLYCLLGLCVPRFVVGVIIRNRMTVVARFPSTFSVGGFVWGCWKAAQGRRFIGILRIRFTPKPSKS
jgi:hypothetical protein